jgi:hypothetical protein
VELREALDPDQPDGSAIALPPDPELRADLCAPTWKLTARGILLVKTTSGRGWAARLARAMQSSWHVGIQPSCDGESTERGRTVLAPFLFLASASMDGVNCRPASPHSGAMCFLGECCDLGLSTRIPITDADNLPLARPAAAIMGDTRQRRSWRATAFNFVHCAGTRAATGYAIS